MYGKEENNLHTKKKKEPYERERVFEDNTVHYNLFNSSRYFKMGTSGCMKRKELEGKMI
jgi:hypothetical protein